MSSDFFTVQRHYKKLSFVFYGLFCFVVILHVMAMLIVCLVLTYTLTNSVDLSYWFMGIAGLFLYIIVGIAFQKQKVLTGGRAIAERMGAVRLLVANNSPEPVYRPNFIRVAKTAELPSSYARAYEFAEQMSLASGVPLPAMYVLPSEKGVNAFVAGFDVQDTVLVLTQGAVDELDNDSLYGLIGHEFGHILHGDAKLNLRVYVMMAGLSWLYEAAEWLSDFALGDFQKKEPAVSANAMHTHDDWVRYWRQQNAKYRQRERGYNSSEDAEAEAFALLAVLPVVSVLVVLRLFGLIGMASHEWIVAKFNRQREFLADATSMQLTRSSGIVVLLNRIEQGVPTVIDVPYSTHMGHFFFASISDEGMFDTHPKVQERLLALNAYHYQNFGQAITEHLNKDKLKHAHDIICLHEPIVPLSQVKTSYETIEFQSVQDRVVDGRLVVDEAWYDWNATDEINENQHQNDSERACDVSVSACYYSPTSKQTVADLWGTTHTYQDDKQTDSQALMTYNDLKAFNAHWEITKHERKFIGAIALVHTLLALKSGTVSVNNDNQTLTLGCIYGIDSSKALLPHTLNNKLVRACTDVHWQMYGILTVRAIRMMVFHLVNPNIALSNRELVTKAKYQRSIEDLVCHDISDFKKPVSPSYQALLSNTDKLWRAGVLASMIRGLKASPKHTLDSLSPHNEQMLNNKVTAVIKAVLTTHETLTHPQAVLLCLLMLVVGVQDNSLLLDKIEPIRTSLLRFCRLIDVSLATAIEQVDSAALSSMIYRLHLVSVGDWVYCLLVLQAQGVSFCDSVLEVLHTAFLYDGKLTQTEYDCLCVMAQLFGCKFSKIVVQ